LLPALEESVQTTLAFEGALRLVQRDGLKKLDV
jgi:hypothetical protein